MGLMGKIVAMFYAVYRNGAIEMKPTFEMLHHSSEHIILFAKCHTYTSCKHYRFLNQQGETTILTLNGCKLLSVIYNISTPTPSIELEVERPSRGVERVEAYRQDGFYIPPLSIIAFVIDKINRVGFDEWAAKNRELFTQRVVFRE
ncbi:MAG: hypothetical protein IKL20_01655 [Alistipes sp.]|nr:hypothetical protein [Alistipes sp.]